MPSTEAPQNAPEVLVLPTMTEVPQGPDGAPLGDDAADIVLVPVAGDGCEEQLVALAFTSVPALVEAIGEKQSWVILPIRQVRKALGGSGATAVLVDPQLPACGERRSARG
ncbi:SAV_915 family protein [Streptomyces sp. NPDC046832]|uniref:SAV_915 family protein n=1 Tax=Streptomyces sp. NPDC046832 TaxID=3155020 RepID=UPI0033FE8118